MLTVSLRNSTTDTHPFVVIGLHLHQMSTACNDTPTQVPQHQGSRTEQREAHTTLAITQLYALMYSRCRHGELNAYQCRLTCMHQTSIHIQQSLAHCRRCRLHTHMLHCTRRNPSAPVSLLGVSPGKHLGTTMCTAMSTSNKQQPRCCCRSFTALAASC